MVHALPPDRGDLPTEGRHAQARGVLDLLDTDELVGLVVSDQRDAVEAAYQVVSDLADCADEIAHRMRQGGRLIYIGAGTSGRLGVLDASECPPTFGADPEQVVGIIAGGDASLRRSSESAEDDPDGAVEQLAHHLVGQRDTVVGIAAGGTTPWVLGGLANARTRGATTVLLTCVTRSKPVQCDRMIVLETGAEILAGSTRLKAGTATKIALNALTTAVFVRLGSVHADLMVDLRATNDKLLDRAIRILRIYAPEMDRGEAAAWIRGSAGHLKTAIVAVQLGITPDKARRHLEAVDGDLRAALG